MLNIPTHRSPTHPGEVLWEEFLQPLEITEQALADSIFVSYQYIKEIIAERQSITPQVALRLAKFFATSVDFWLNLQLRWDLYCAEQEERLVLATIMPLKPLLPR